MNMAGIGLDFAEPVVNPPMPERIDPDPPTAPTDFTFQPHHSAAGDALITPRAAHSTISRHVISGLASTASENPLNDLERRYPNLATLPLSNERDVTDSNAIPVAPDPRR